MQEQTRLLNEFQYRMAVDLLGRFQAVRYASNDEEIQAADLPNELVSRYVSAPDADGKRKWLLQIYPKERIWDEAPLTRFMTDLRTVDANVTGTPIQNHESAHQIRHSYETAALYAFAVVWIVLLVDFWPRGTLAGPVADAVGDGAGRRHAARPAHPGRPDAVCRRLRDHDRGDRPGDRRPQFAERGASPISCRWPAGC